MSGSRGLSIGLALAAAALAGCGGGGGGRDAREALDQTAAKVRDIRSADLALRMVLEPRQDAAKGRVGFALSGPIALSPAAGLPKARVTYTQIAGAKQGSATFVSTGKDVFVEVGDQAYRLPKAQRTALASSAGSVRDGVEVPVGRWVVDPKLSDGGQVGGAATDHISAELDPVAALRDIFATARRAGAQVPDLQGAAADELRRAVRSTSIEIWSGRDDHLLRRLRLQIGFQVTPPAALRQRLGELVGGRLALDIDLSKVNEPVTVAAPQHPRPASALGHG